MSASSITAVYFLTTDPSPRFVQIEFLPGKPHLLNYLDIEPYVPWFNPHPGAPRALDSTRVVIPPCENTPPKPINEKYKGEEVFVIHFREQTLLDTRVINAATKEVNEQSTVGGPLLVVKALRASGNRRIWNVLDIEEEDLPGVRNALYKMTTL